MEEKILEELAFLEKHLKKGYPLPAVHSLALIQIIRILLKLKELKCQTPNSNPPQSS